MLILVWVSSTDATDLGPASGLNAYKGTGISPPSNIPARYADTYSCVMNERVHDATWARLDGL